MKFMTGLRIIVLLFACGVGTEAEEGLWKAGTARAIITPAEPMWMAGFASRTSPAEGKYMELWVKALALEDQAGHRAVIVSSDLLGFPQQVYRNICASVAEKFGLKPDQIILSASHTHCGPVLKDALYDIYPFTDAQIPLIEKYTAELEVKVVDTIGKSLAEMGAVRLAVSQGKAGFAVNRRNNSEGEVPRLIRSGELKGPTDHSVPVLAVYLPDGKLKAVVFGYACHNTVMNFNQWGGDYAGFAQRALEQSHPEATAMFMMGCGADQNALPRRQIEICERYGNMLASAVEEALVAPPHALKSELKTSIQMVTLRLGEPPKQADLEKLKAGSVPFLRKWATRLEAEAKSGKSFIREYPYPIQAWRLGGEQLLVTLGGEPVVDHALRIKKQFGEQTWVAGYCNDVMTYIPSSRVLEEDKPEVAKAGWGYEGSRSLAVYGLPAFRWADDVEARVQAGVEAAVKAVSFSP